MSTDRWQGLPSRLREQFKNDMTRHEAELFCEVEAVLHLYQTIRPEPTGRDAREAWVLVSGYSISEVNAEPESLRMCLVLRSNLRYVRTASAWNWWLDIYLSEPEMSRLFQFHPREDEPLEFEQKLHDVPLLDERLSTYTHLITQTIVDGAREALPFATAGRYEFEADRVAYEVTITASMARFAETPLESYPLPKRSDRLEIHIDWDEITKTAREIDELEDRLTFEPCGHWESRLIALRLAVTREDGTVEIQRQFTLQGLFHLVGVLGVGKSSLIWVLVYLLAKRGLHVTVAFETVVESYRFASWLRRLGVSATPALGTNRTAHAAKVGLANAEALSISRVFSQDAPIEPILDWMPSICALSGASPTPIPSGSEPCIRLMNENGSRYRCPLFPVCPVHAARRDLVTSQVWIVNPMSLLYSSAPDGVGEGNLRLLDAIYRLSDVLIIDEADRVQVQWDRVFAPTNPLAGSDNAFLDRLHRALGQVAVGGYGRRRAARATFNRLTRSDDQANTLANYVFRLLSKSRANAAWIKDRQLTNYGMFSRLALELARAAPTGVNRPELATKLRAAFRQFWVSPLSRGGGELTDWINNLLGTDADEKRLRQALKQWLTGQMGWTLPLTSRQKVLLKRLELCLSISAMLKRTNDIYFQLRWIEDELDLDDTGDFELSDKIVELVPDPPLGVLLGARLVGYHWAHSLGIFTALRYRGIGRWLLLNLPHLYADLTGEIGPHVLLTSATSWFPGAAQFDLAVPPHAILLPAEDAQTSRIEVHFKPIEGTRSNWIRVSGAHARRKANLQQIVRELAKDGLHTPSDLQRELDFWRESGTARRLLLVVGSYEQTGWVLEAFQSLPAWAGRVARLLPDDTEMLDEHTLRTREAERFRDRDADILIAPLMAIQRGFNILDDLDEALLGSVYFLVRPYPPPDDLTPQVLSQNAWAIRQLHSFGRVLRSEYAGIGAMRQLRRHANHEWHRRLTSGRRGLNSMSEPFYEEFLRDQFILVWQTIGRLLRGGRDARVYFVDGAFSTRQGSRHILLDWHSILAKLLKSDNPQEQYLAQALYSSIGNAFQQAVDNKEIY